jgi:hypothetical protein
MQHQQFTKEELNQEQKSFEKEQAQAFNDFMEAHFGNPPCQKCLSKYQ